MEPTTVSDMAGASCQTEAFMAMFRDLGLSEELLTTLDELGYEDPTAIQEQAIPELLGGRDVIGQAQTGTGKTAAFGLPLLQYLDVDSPDTQAIVLTPTRELCIQVTQALRTYAEHLPVEVVAVFGGQAVATQQSRLRAGAQVVVATVGRMLDLVNRGSLLLSSARFIVLDEADEMLDLGFIEDVERILRGCPGGRQTALFSATIPPPIAHLAEGYMYEPVTIKVTPKQLTVDAIEQAFVEVSARDKAEQLEQVLRAEEPEQAIIFCRTKIGTAKLDDRLRARGFRVKALHGDLTQGQRDGVMLAFKEHKLPLLVATDVAARGLDIEHVTHVINFDVPGTTESYVHRIGRTGRVGRTGRAITFVTSAQRDDIPRIEREAKTVIGEWEAPEDRIEHAPRPRRRDHARPRAVENGRGPVEREPEPRREPKVAAEPELVAEPQAAAEPAAASEGPKPAGDGHVKLFVNRGERSGIDEDDLRWALVEGAVVPEAAIGPIRVLERFSFVELADEHAEQALERLDGTKLKGKQVRVEYAKG
jgi:ATP-dependent RNA helicase DeaD